MGLSNTPISYPSLEYTPSEDVILLLKQNFPRAQAMIRHWLQNTSSQSRFTESFFTLLPDLISFFISTLNPKAFDWSIDSNTDKNLSNDSRELSVLIQEMLDAGYLIKSGLSIRNDYYGAYAQLDNKQVWLDIMTAPKRSEYKTVKEYFTILVDGEKFLQIYHRYKQHQHFINEFRALLLESLHKLEANLLEQLAFLPKAKSLALDTSGKFPELVRGSFLLKEWALTAALIPNISYSEFQSVIDYSFIEIMSQANLLSSSSNMNNQAYDEILNALIDKIVVCGRIAISDEKELLAKRHYEAIINLPIKYNEFKYRIFAQNIKYLIEQRLITNFPSEHPIAKYIEWKLKHLKAPGIAMHPDVICALKYDAKYYSNYFGYAQEGSTKPMLSPLITPTSELLYLLLTGDFENQYSNHLNEIAVQNKIKSWQKNLLKLPSLDWSPELSPESNNPNTAKTLAVIHLLFDLRLYDPLINILKSCSNADSAQILYNHFHEKMQASIPKTITQNPSHYEVLQRQFAENILPFLTFIDRKQSMEFLKKIPASDTVLTLFRNIFEVNKSSKLYSFIISMNMYYFTNDKISAKWTDLMRQVKENILTSGSRAKEWFLNDQIDELRLLFASEIGEKIQHFNFRSYSEQDWFIFDMLRDDQVATLMKEGNSTLNLLIYFCSNFFLTEKPDSFIMARKNRILNLMSTSQPEMTLILSNVEIESNKILKNILFTAPADLTESVIRLATPLSLANALESLLRNLLSQEEILKEFFKQLHANPKAFKLLLSKVISLSSHACRDLLKSEKMKSFFESHDEFTHLSCELYAIAPPALPVSAPLAEITAPPLPPPPPYAMEAPKEIIQDKNINMEVHEVTVSNSIATQTVDVEPAPQVEGVSVATQTAPQVNTHYDHAESGHMRARLNELEIQLDDLQKKHDKLLGKQATDSYLNVPLTQGEAYKLFEAQSKLLLTAFSQGQDVEKIKKLEKAIEQKNKLIAAMAKERIEGKNQVSKKIERRNSFS